MSTKALMSALNGAAATKLKIHNDDDAATATVSSPLSTGDLGAAPVNLWSELAAVELDDEIPSPLEVDDIPCVTIINGMRHETMAAPIDEPQTMEELQKRRALRLEQLRVEEEELMRWLKDIETSPTAALPSSVILDHTSSSSLVTSPNRSHQLSGAYAVPLPSLPPLPTEAPIEEMIEDPYAIAVTVPATPSSPILMPPPRAMPPRGGRPQLSITIGTPLNNGTSGENHTPASGLPAGAAAAGITESYDLGTVRRRAAPERFTFTSFDITRSQQLRDLLWSFSPISGPPSFRLLPGTTLRTTVSRPRTGSSASLSQSPACPATPPSSSAAARLSAHRRRPSGRSAFGSGTWLVPPGVGIDELGAGAAAANQNNDGMTTPSNARSPSLLSSTGSSPQTPLPTMSPMIPIARSGRDATPLSLRGRRPRALPLTSINGEPSTNITTWHESKDEEENEEEVSRSSMSSISVASESLAGDDDHDNDNDSDDDTSPSSSSLSSSTSVSRRGSRRTGSTISSSSVANGVTSPPLSTSSNASTSTNITTWSSVSSVSSLSARYPPPPLPPPPPLSVIQAQHAAAAAAAAAAAMGSPLPPPTPPIVDYTSFGSGSSSGVDIPTGGGGAGGHGRGRGNSDSAIRAIRDHRSGSMEAHAASPQVDASRIALRRQAKRDRALQRLVAARHENREVDIEVRMLTTPSE